MRRARRRAGFQTAGEGTRAVDENGAFASSGVTHWLKKWHQGDERALEEVMVQTYDELRRVASRYLQQERREHTLQPTALVHEV